MKRSPLQRKTPLKARKPLSARKPMQKRRKAQKAVQKDCRFRSEAYLAFVRSLPCSVCSQLGVDAHHVIGLHWGLSGWGLTAPDTYSLPACRTCHSRIHAEPALQRMQPAWLIDTINRGLDQFTHEPIVGELTAALEFIHAREAV